jgi:hypothetical protein
LNPQDEDSFPPGLIDALSRHATSTECISIPLNSINVTLEAKLRKQMHEDALEPLPVDNGDYSRSDTSVDLDAYSDVLEETSQFLRLQVR